MASRSSSKAWNLIYQPRASGEGVVLGRLKWCHGFAIIYMAMTERRIRSGVTRGLIRAVLGSATVRLPMSHHVAPPPKKKMARNVKLRLRPNLPRFLIDSTIGASHWTITYC